MIPTNKSKVTVLGPYMEIIGPFTDLEEQDGVLLAEIARHTVVLPLELKNKLAPLLGRRIAVLRTDIPGKEYLFRILQEGDPGLEQGATPMIVRDLGQEKRISDCVEVIGWWKKDPS